MSDTRLTSSDERHSAPTHPHDEDRADSVTRMLAALSAEAADGVLGQDTLRRALDSEGTSFIDVPEVGLWLALTDIALRADSAADTDPQTDADSGTGSEIVIDLRTDPVVHPAEPGVDAAPPLPTLIPWLTDVLGTVRVDLPDGSHRGTARPTEPPLPSWLRRVLSGLRVDLRDGSHEGTAVPEPSWPPAARRRTTGAVADRIRSGLPPRVGLELESELRSVLHGAAVIGDVDLEPYADELVVSLRRAGRQRTLVELVDAAPATVAAMLVRHARHHPRPADFDETLPVEVLRESNEIGHAFSASLAALGLTDFHEMGRRGGIEPRARHTRRLQLHVGLADRLPAVVDEVAASFWSGAASGHEVAQDWLTARRVVRTSVGEPAYLLLTATELGDGLLDALVRLVRSHHLDGGVEGRDDDFTPLAPALVEQARDRLCSQPSPPHAWGTRVRPRLRLGSADGPGPELVLPASSGRWHLNDELLTYASPVHDKVVPFPPSRTRKWSVTMGSTSRRSPHDVGFISATTDRIIVVFDEHGRYHHPLLPLGGASATVIVPAGSAVSGATSRTAMRAAWAGYDRVEVDLDGTDAVEVTTPSRPAVSIAVGRRSIPRLAGRPCPDLSGPDGEQVTGRECRVEWDGFVPPWSSLEIEVQCGHRCHQVNWAPVAISEGLGSLPLAPAVNEATEQHTAAELTVSITQDRRVRHHLRAISVAGLDLGRLPVTGLHPTARIDGRPDRRGRSAIDRLWTTEPATAALLDPFGQAGVDGATERWTVATGWEPPRPDGDPIAALKALFAPLVDALTTTDDDPTLRLIHRHPGERPSLMAPLDARSWQFGIATEAPALDHWAAAHRRAIDQWRLRLPALGNVSWLWPTGPARRIPATSAVLTLVAAGLISAVDGPRRTAATALVDDAAVVAPQLAASATVLGIAYRHVQRDHPHSRFMSVNPAPRGPADSPRA